MESKKSSIILIQKVLEEYSDENHFLTQQEIIDLVKKEFNLSLERKSVSYSLELLQENGFELKKSSKGGYAYIKRNITKEDAYYLLDGIFSSKNIDNKKAHKLTRKIMSNLSKYERDEFKNLTSSKKIVDQDMNTLYENIKIINTAIRLNKKIGFNYLDYDKKANQILRDNGFEYIVSPYYLINNYGKYYLLGNYLGETRLLQIFKVEKLTNLTLKDEKLTPLEELSKDMKDFSIEEFLNNQIYLEGGDIINAELTLDTPKVIASIYETFGDNAFIYYKDKVLYAKIKGNQTAIANFLMNHLKETNIVEPQSLKRKLLIMMKEIQRKYYRPL